MWLIRRPRLILVIDSGSGSGKSTLINGLLRTGGFGLVTSYTTREKRPDDAKDLYLYVSHDVIEGLSDVIQLSNNFGQVYACTRESVDGVLRGGRHAILAVTPHSARQYLAAYPDAITLTIRPPGTGELERRMRRQRPGISDQDLYRRLGEIPFMRREAENLSRHHFPQMPRWLTVWWALWVLLVVEW